MKYHFHSLTVLALFVSSHLAAQTTPFAITAFTMTGKIVQTEYTNLIVGTGSATFSPGGVASFAASGSSTRLRWDGCAGTAGDVFQIPITFTFNSTDTLKALYTGPNSNLTMVSGSLALTGGTGKYASTGGSGTLMVNGVSDDTGQFAFTSGSGSGTMTATPTVLPLISPSGIVPVNSTIPIVQPGSWISIYGTNLAAATTISDGVGGFPMSLGNVSVTINGKPGFLWYAGPGQINVQAPDDTSTSCVNVVVNTPNGAATSSITLRAQQPSFSLLTPKYVVGVIPVPTGIGAYGTGTGSYDLLGPANTFSFKTRPVKVGETLVLYGAGFGPTNPTVPSGQLFSSAAPLAKQVSVVIGGKPASVTFAGLVGEGLYQLNVIVPSVPPGDASIQAFVNGQNSFFQGADSSQPNVFIIVQ